MFPRYEQVINGDFCTACKYQLDTIEARNTLGSRDTVAVSVNDWRAIVLAEISLPELGANLFPLSVWPSLPPFPIPPSLYLACHRVSYSPVAKANLQIHQWADVKTRDPGDNIPYVYVEEVKITRALPLSRSDPLSLSLSVSTTRSNMCQRRRNGEWKLARREPCWPLFLLHVCVYHVSSLFISRSHTSC